MDIRESVLKFMILKGERINLMYRNNKHMVKWKNFHQLIYSSNIALYYSYAEFVPYQIITKSICHHL